MMLRRWGPHAGMVQREFTHVHSHPEAYDGGAAITDNAAQVWSPLRSGLSPRSGSPPQGPPNRARTEHTYHSGADCAHFTAAVHAPRMQHVGRPAHAGSRARAAGPTPGSRWEFLTGRARGSCAAQNPNPAGHAMHGALAGSHAAASQRHGGGHGHADIHQEAGGRGMMHKQGSVRSSSPARQVCASWCWVRHNRLLKLHH